METFFDFMNRTEPYSEAELKAMWERSLEEWLPLTSELSPDHEEVMNTISQFEACVDEIILQPYRETVHE